MIRARPEPKDRRPPVALRHGFALQKWNASRQNFQEGGPRTFPGIASLRFVNRFENSWYLQRLQYVRKIVTRDQAQKVQAAPYSVDRIATAVGTSPQYSNSKNCTSDSTSYPKKIASA